MKARLPFQFLGVAVLTILTGAMLGALALGEDRLGNIVIRRPLAALAAFACEVVGVACLLAGTALAVSSGIKKISQRKDERNDKDILANRGRGQNGGGGGS